MNSQQRRRAYRAMPKPGTVFHYNRGGGVIVAAVSAGPAIMAEQFDEQRRNAINPNRVRARLLRDGDDLDMPSGGTVHPLVSRIVRAA